MKLNKQLLALLKKVFKPGTINWAYWGPVLTFTFLYVVLMMEFSIIALSALRLHQP